MGDTILVLDTSGSMKGHRLRQLKQAVVSYIEMSEKVGFQERIALISFGANVSIVQHLTSDYALLKRRVNSLEASGSTPMAEGLLKALEEFSNARIIAIGPVNILPRIILMTDGVADDKAKVLMVSDALGKVGLPVACVGVDGCDEPMMKKLAATTGGMFVKAHNIDALVEFFLKQLMLVLFAAKMAQDIAQIFEQEALRAFLENECGQQVSDEELAAFLILLKHVVKVEQPQQKRITGSATTSNKTPTTQRTQTQRTPTQRTPTQRTPTHRTPLIVPKSNKNCCILL